MNIDKIRNSKFEIRNEKIQSHAESIFLAIKEYFPLAKIRNSKFEIRISKTQSHAVSIFLALKKYFPLTKIKNESSLRVPIAIGTKQSLLKIDLRLPRFARNDEYRTLNIEYRRSNNEQRTTNNEQRTTNNQQRTSNFILHTLYFILLTSSLKAQITADSNNLISTFQVNAKYIQADELSNLYIVNQSNQLYKYNSEGKILATLNYNYNGNISSIDASNPMEIYVFYKELNRVIFLDNNLAYRGEIDLTKNNITQASAIARSYDNGLWVFDLGDLQLKKIDKEGKMFQSSGNIKQFSRIDFLPKQIYENTQNLVLSDDSICLIFDVFASYVKTLNLNDIISLQMSNDILYITHKYSINNLSLKFGLLKSDILLESKINLTWSYFYKNRFYLLENNTVNFYKF